MKHVYETFKTVTFTLKNNSDNPSDDVVLQTRVVKEEGCSIMQGYGPIYTILSVVLRLKPDPLT